MLKLPMLLALLILIACSNVEEKRKVAWKSWEGRSAGELKKHPYFKYLPRTKVKHANEIETWVYRDQTRYQSDARCQSLGGCQGMIIYNCNNAFSIKNDVIIGLEQNGTCPDPKSISPITE